MNRRDLLKHFGIGAAIVPLVGGVPELQAEAKLIQEPKIELAAHLTSIPTNAYLNGSSFSYGRHAITVDIKPERGPQIRFAATAFICEIQTSSPLYFGPFAAIATTDRHRLEFTIKGLVSGQSASEILSLI